MAAAEYPIVWGKYAGKYSTNTGTFSKTSLYLLSGRCGVKGRSERISTVVDGRRVKKPA